MTVLWSAKYNCLKCLMITNTAATHILMAVSLDIRVSDCRTEVWMRGCWVSGDGRLNRARCYQIVFQGTCACPQPLPAFPAGYAAPVPPHPCQHLLLWVFGLIAKWTLVNCCLIGVSFISSCLLMKLTVFFICLLTLWVSSPVKCLSKLLSIFLLGY